MKITDVNVEVSRWPRRVPIRNGRHVYDTSGLNVVRVETVHEQSSWPSN